MNKRWTVGLAVVVCGFGIVLSGCGGAKWTCDQVSEQLAASKTWAIQPSPREEEWWKTRQAAIDAQVQKGNVDLLLLGDSITHSWEALPVLWKKYFGPWNTINAGFGGDQTQQVLWRVSNGNLNSIQPKAVVIMIGTNNSGGNTYTAEDIADGIAAIVCRLRTELPHTKILLLAIFPRGSEKQMGDKTMDATYNPQWAKNDKASQLASKLADGKNVFYLNINKAFLNDKGVLTRAIMPDLLHLSEKGYEIWGEAMMPTLEKLMAGK
jgi:lysophospholipase L1-like esterase